MTIKVFPVEESTDLRGNKIMKPSEEGVIIRVGSVTPDRSSRAEVPGQQEITVYQIRMNDPIDPSYPPVTLWSGVEMWGQMWDIVSPPDHRVGSSRHTRHQTLKVRLRTIKETHG